jgi:hypothetical protein
MVIETKDDPRVKAVEYLHSQIVGFNTRMLFGGLLYELAVRAFKSEAQLAAKDAVIRELTNALGIALRCGTCSGTGTMELDCPCCGGEMHASSVEMECAECDGKMLSGPYEVIKVYRAALAAAALPEQGGRQMSYYKVDYFAVREDKASATPLYMVCYRIPGEQHILCDGMYEWAANWLVRKLNASHDYPTPVL